MGGTHAENSRNGPERMDETVELEIESLSYGSDAVAHTADGRVVFVRGGCPGDVVVARVTRKHPRRLSAVVAEVITPSADRVAPPCPFFGECGGCQWQHVAYAAQLDAKRRAVADTLARIAKIDAPVRDVVPSPKEYGYRNHVELRVGTMDKRTVVGYSALGEERLVPVDRCLLLPDRFQKAPDALGGVLRFLARDPRTGPVNRIGIRVAVHGGDVEVDLWTPPGPFPRQLAARAIADATRAATVARVLVRDQPLRRDVAGVEVLSGGGAWHESLGEFAYAVSAPSFFQVNTRVAEEMTRIVVAALDVSGSDRVLDLYAGVGTFTLPLAATGADIVAVEGAGSAVRDLRRNLEDNGLYADVAPGDAARALADLGRFDLAVVDPPRAGMRPDALSALVSTSPRRLVYVSCDPATLARDARALVDAGYALHEVTPVDLFPQSFHVEAIAVFDRA